MNGSQRAARAALLADLEAEGVSLEEMRRAVAEHRLALLPAELALGGRGTLTLTEVAERAGLDEHLLRAYVSALGLTMPPGDVPVADETDVAAARVLVRLVEAGLPVDGLLEVTRISGQWLPSLAQAVVRMAGEAFLRPGDSELEVARRYRAVAEELRPLLGQVLEQHLTQHLRQAIRAEVLSQQQITGGGAAAEQVAVAFADLSGFTRLGSRVPPDAIGEIAGRLASLTTEAVVQPVRVVKYLGDAVMLVSHEPGALLETLLRLCSAVDAEADTLPPLHAGAALGPAVTRAGDWFGHTVNLASRIAEVARSGSIIGDAALRDATVAGHVWMRLPRRHLRGIPGRVEMYRLRGRRTPEDGRDQRL